MPKQKLCPDCGETDPAKFYGKGHKLCRKCTSIKNKDYYQSMKAQREQLRKSRHKKGNDRCIETPEMSVSGEKVFFKFCAARREIKRGSGIGIPNCGDCGLGPRVDGGFLPVNIFLI